MLDVSSAMKQYVNNRVRDARQYVRIEIAVEEIEGGKIILNLSDMVNGSVIIKRRSVSSTNFDIGQSYIDEAQFAVDRETLEDIYSDDLVGHIVQIIYGVHNINNTDIVAEQEDEEVVIFTGVIPQSGVTNTIMTTEIKLDSMLSDLCVKIEGLTSATPMGYFNWIANRTGITLATRLTDYVEHHINNQYTYYITEESKIQTYLDVAMWLSQILGGAVTANNLGELDFVIYDEEAEAYELYEGICKTSQVGSQPHFFNACSIVIDNEEIKVIGTGADTYVLQLSDNPFLVNIQDDLLRGIIIANIFNQMAPKPLQAFSYTYNGNPLLELGDKISYKGKTTFVEAIEYGFRKNSKLEGYTIDNRLTTQSQGVRSASHSGGGGTPSSEVLGVLKWVNAEQIVINEINNPDGVEIAKEYFALYANTKAMLATTINFVAFSTGSDVNANVYLVVEQYYDNVKLPMTITKQIDIRYSRAEVISFNVVVPESDIYETHEYKLVFTVRGNYSSLGEYAYVYVPAFNIETDIIGFMAAGGQPDFPGAYFCEDRVALKTDTTDVPTIDVGTLTEEVEVDVTQ